MERKAPPRHGRAVRERAAEMFARGCGCKAVARALDMPREAVRDWQSTYRSAGREGLLNMGKRHRAYDAETKVAAARAVVEEGMPKPAAMERFGVASASTLKSWCRLYREGGSEALAPRPKGRPRKAPATREQELEREVERLGAQVAYLKKSIALKEALGLLPGTGPKP